MLELLSKLPEFSGRLPRTDSDDSLDAPPATVPVSAELAEVARQWFVPTVSPVSTRDSSAAPSPVRGVQFDRD